MSDLDDVVAQWLLDATTADDLVVVGGAPAASPGQRAALGSRLPGRRLARTDLAQAPAGRLAAAALVADEVSHARDHAEAVIDAAAVALRPGGLLVVTACNRLHAGVVGRDLDLRGFSAGELDWLLGQRGFALDVLCAPGAGARVRGDACQRLDPRLDCQPGLLDAAPRLLAAARAPVDAAARSARFFATLPRKVVAAAVLCRRADERVLLVHDRFKRHWTIPGGVVDAGEDPRTAAVREAWEEAGVHVEPGMLLGVFAGSSPDRLLLVYAARARAAARPAPLHEHEIDDAAWLPVEQALATVPAWRAEQIRRCLEQPGETWAAPD